MHTIHKFRDITEVQNYLNGGLLGTDISKGVTGLVGTTLTFTSPAGAVTFVEGANSGHTLLFLDIKTQLETAIAAIRVYQIGGQIAFLHSASPVTLPVVLAAGVSPAKYLLGFDDTASTAGRIIKDSASATGPRLFWWNTTNDGSHAIMIWEG